MEFLEFKSKFRDIYLELIILGRADVEAMSKCMKEYDIDDYNSRIGFFKSELAN